MAGEDDSVIELTASSVKAMNRRKPHADVSARSRTPREDSKDQVREMADDGRSGLSWMGLRRVTAELTEAN